MSQSTQIILMIEDNDDHAELVQRAIDDLPFKGVLRRLADGQSALDYLFRRKQYAEQHQSPRPHVILLDLRIPRIDGLEVLRQIKATPNLRDIPVVVLTTSSEQRDIMAAYQNQANSFLVKPVGFMPFGELIRELCSYWLTLNVQPAA